MTRFHARVHVTDLDSSVRFYSTLFGAEPTVLKQDYAKWMLDYLRVNFAITAGASEPGLDHLGIQVEEADDLVIIAGRLEAASISVIKQENASCCYARGDKGWITDPSGISWETFRTFSGSTVYGSDVAPRPTANLEAPVESCCTPAVPAAKACCGTAPAR
jgi:extradiol dioxygenase family protein